MRTRILMITVAAALAAPATAAADYVHTVAPGETLTSVAAADGLSVAQLAAANGLSIDSQLVAGAPLAIPPQSAGVQPATASAATADASEGSTESAAPASPSSGGYVVQPGDTLSALAAAHGLTVAQLAAANGLDPAGYLISGTTLSFPGASDLAVSAPSSPAVAASSGGPEPTAETVSPSTVASVAASDGVSPSLADAIGYQESGFNNNLVSATGATGVMQIEPGTWDWIGSNLAPSPPLSPASAIDNVRGGVLLLRSLLDQSGGDPALAAAGYYQGLASVQAHGMYTDTQQYVNDVMALRSRFGGP